MKYFLSLSILAAVLSIGGFSRGSAEEGAYPPITGPCDLQFPQDHGPHPGYHTEWWYYTGNVRSDNGERYGFQLTIFRSRLNPPGAERSQDQGSAKESAWRTQQLFLAHVALSDIGSKRFHYREQVARGAVGLADAVQEADTTTVFIKNWSIRLNPSEHTLKASAEDFEFQLNLTPQKPLVLHGESGYSLKGTTPERSSCYYSFPRMEVKGTLKIKGREIPVQGKCWMDHEFSSAPLEPDLAGWDWFSVQLTDNTELMIYLLRHKDGTYSPASSGTFVDAFGKVVRLARDAFAVEVLDTWTSPHTLGRYPSRWKIRVPSLKLDLNVRPNLEDQEMRTQESIGVTYWEGSVGVSGKTGGQPVEGEGYVELTGYASPLGSRP